MGIHLNVRNVLMMLILILLHNNVINVLGGLYMMLSRDSVPL